MFKLHQALMHALLELADRTTYVEPLRKEAAEALSTHGLTRAKGHREHAAGR